eukprot:s4289_g2.t1
MATTLGARGNKLKIFNNHKWSNFGPSNFASNHQPKFPGCRRAGLALELPHRKEASDNLSVCEKLLLYTSVASNGFEVTGP